MNTPRYLRSFTHGNATPVVVYTEAHATSLLDPIGLRKQHDFLVLITISSKSSSFSQILSNFTILASRFELGVGRRKKGQYRSQDRIA